MSLSRPIGLLVAVLATVLAATLAFGASVAWATTPAGPFQWPDAAPGGTLTTAVAILVVAGTLIGAAVYGYVTLRPQRGSSELASVRPIGAASARPGTERERKAA